jgi:hypothetical protein
MARPEDQPTKIFLGFDGQLMTTIETPGLLTFTISIVVFFAGSGLNHLIVPLRRWNIPEAVTGGFACCARDACCA